MGSCSRDTLAVEILHGIPAHLLLLKSCQGDVDGLHLVSDSVPALLHNLASLLITHQGKLTFDLSCSLALVHSIGAHSLDLDSAFEFASSHQLLLLAPQLVG